jgi:hypothetical protein
LSSKPKEFLDFAVNQAYRHCLEKLEMRALDPMPQTKRELREVQTCHRAMVRLI